MTGQRVRAESRRRVFERARRCCEYCRSPEQYSPDPFAVEHIIPVIKGGTATLDNLALSCQGCNGHKHTKEEAPDPITGSVVPLYHPRKQRWRDHFAWRAGAKFIDGLTPTGRATVEALRMNRPELVNLREVLYAAQKHPPAEPDTQ